ncbi:MAG TPA: MFS transporter, partial [Bryobacteraceae bacterium]|nr:MFS transporter [Bryobacteraceae bacterium]
MNRPIAAERFRWLVLTVFILSTAINYLDRQTLATLAPVLRAEFHLSNAGYGLIIAAFSLTYAASAPFAGLLIDRIGLNRAITCAVALWSCAGMATGFTRGIPGLVGCRAVLGVAEAAGIPGAGKAIHQYLRPAERALGNALNQAGVSLGLVLAPPLATFLAVRGDWRQAFIITGLLGLLWIPVWKWAARRAGAAPAPKTEADALLLRDRRLWIFVAANALAMAGYSLWTNWTTLYLVEVHHLTLVQAAWYAWIPPLFATAGGFAGGWISLRLVDRGVPPIHARVRACAVASVLALATAAIPLAPGAAWAS